MTMLLLSMEGCLKVTLPQSGFVQQENQQGQKTVGFLFTTFTYFSQQFFACYLGVSASSEA
jgi:hypothetical protein